MHQATSRKEAVQVTATPRVACSATNLNTSRTTRGTRPLGKQGSRTTHAHRTVSFAGDKHAAMDGARAERCTHYPRTSVAHWPCRTRRSTAGGFRTLCTSSQSPSVRAQPTPGAPIQSNPIQSKPNHTRQPTNPFSCAGQTGSKQPPPIQAHLSVA